MNKLKVIINTPDISKTGGVANFYRCIQDKFSSEIVYNYIGGSSKKSIPLWYLIRDYINFVKKIIRIKPDIVHLNPSLDKKSIIRDSVFIIIARLFSIKILVSWHGWKERMQDKISSNPRLFRAFYRNANSMTVLSKDFKIKLENWGIKCPVFVTTTLYDEKILENLDTQKKGPAKQILFLSRVEKAKGIYTLIDAFARLNKTHKINLVVAGNGSDLENCKKYTAENKISGVSFEGYVKGEDKTNIFLSSDIFVLSSESEGMPISLLEAMAFGLAAVVRPVGGIKDFFENGKMGISVESNESKELASAIEIIIDNMKLFEDISDYNRNYAPRIFSSNAVALRIEEIYSKTSAGN